jgi:Sortilin, neurotensin receptor 3, C-terminal
LGEYEGADSVQEISNDVIFTMDLKDVLGGADINGTSLPPRSKCESADFEDWIVSKEDGSAECVLGMQYKYRRVARTNRNAACFLPKDYELATSASEVRLPPCCIDLNIRQCSLLSMHAQYSQERLPRDGRNHDLDKGFCTG